jgi:hypothetical protein
MKKAVFLFGITIFLLALFLGFNLRMYENRAISRDTKKTIFAMQSEDTPPACAWSVNSPDRVMPENKSQAVIIQTSNPSDKNCETYLTIQAPGFEIRPSKEEKKIALPASGKGSQSWILTPIRSGTFEVTFSDIINTKIYGISVTNTFGLTAFQAKISSIVGGIFGPMLTVPWWWEKILLKRKKKEEKIIKDEKES